MGNTPQDMGGMWIVAPAAAWFLCEQLVDRRVGVGDALRGHSFVGIRANGECNVPYESSGRISNER
jgi:hypothetical protein